MYNSSSLFNLLAFRGTCSKDTGKEVWSIITLMFCRSHHATNPNTSLLQITREVFWFPYILAFLARFPSCFFWVQVGPGDCEHQRKVPLDHTPGAQPRRAEVTRCALYNHLEIGWNISTYTRRVPPRYKVVMTPANPIGPMVVNGYN